LQEILMNVQLLFYRCGVVEVISDGDCLPLNDAARIIRIATNNEAGFFHPSFDGQMILWSGGSFGMRLPFGTVAHPHWTLQNPRYL